MEHERISCSDWFPGWRPSITPAEIRHRGKVPRFDGCSLRDWQQRSMNGNVDIPRVLANKLSRSEVERHKEPDDLWMVIGGVVYDVTKFQNYHPGGEVILRQCGGKDVTELFVAYHRWVSCENMIGTCAVGVLADDERRAETNLD